MNNTLLNNQRLEEKVINKNSKYFKTNEIEKTPYQNLWVRAKAVFTEKCMILKAFIKKERSEIDNLT